MRYSRRIVGLLATILVVSVASPLAYAGHYGGRPESFQPDLATGRFSSSIPIPVPPGRRGLQPTLAIAYASGSSAALAGYGWTLEVGATERSTRFGVVTNTENQNAYVFNIGGVTQELVAINPEKTEYRAQAEGAFTKFLYTAPAKWEAWDRAGTYYLMDQVVSDPNGRTYAAYLSKVQDVHGNTMTFTYWTDPDGWNKYLTSIDYTGHTSGLTPTNKVVLTWEPRPDIVYSLKEGLSNQPATFKITQRLQKVETYANNALVRRYTLTYTTSAQNGRSLLTNVRITGADGATSLPQTTYTYSVPSGNYQTTSATTWLSGHGDSNTQVLMADVDRDGKLDLVTYHRSSGAWHWARSTGTGFINLTLITTTGANRQAAVGDFNGDGWTDLGTFDTSSGSGQTDIALATGSGTWGSFTRWLANCGGSGYSWIPADFNGDGKTDWATWEPGNGYVHKGTSTGAGFNWPGHYLTLGGGRAGFLGDFNGDGLADFGATDTGGNVDVWYGDGNGFMPAGRWLTGFTSWQSYAPIPFDVNGDGMTDYATFEKTNGYWHWGMSKGNTFNWPGQYLTGFGTNQQPLTGDFNGDGMPDIGYFTSASGSWTICLRQGDKPDLLTRLENGLGGIVTVTYASSATFDNTVNGVQSLGLTVPVLTAMTVDDGRGNTYTSTFSYSGGVFDYGTREFRGFAYAKVTDPAGHYTETWFHQDEHKKGRPYKETVYAASAGSSGSSETVDQSQPTFTGTQWGVGHDGGDNKRMAQSFVLSGTGTQRIQKVALYVSGTTGSPSGGFTVSLQTNNPTYTQPSGTLVDPNASVLVNPPQVGAWNTVSFPVPLDLTAGTKYWLVVQYAGPIISVNTYELGSGYPELYPAGEMKGAFPGTTVWGDWGGGYDLCFKVYVTTLASTLPPTLLQQVERVWGCVEPYPNTHFCFLQSATTSLYDGQPTPKQTKVDATYDSYGNVLTQVESGDLATTGDERTSVTEYVYNPTAWILGIPSHTQVKDSAGLVVRESWAYYDGNASVTASPTKGLLTKEEVWLSTAAAKPTSTHAYDACGNKTSTTDPLGRTTTTTYDSACLFPIRVTNAVGHTLQTTYDPGTGNVLTTTDPNGQVTTNAYDPLGRILSVTGPLDTPSAPGVLYSYDLTVFPSKRVKSVRTTPGGSELYTSYEFYDGMDRLIQVKSPAEDPTKQVVTGTQVFDARGLVKEAYKPSLTTSSTTFSTPDLTQPKMTYTYDPLGRTTKVTNPDATFATTAYTQWVVTLTDEAGKQKVRTVDAYGKLVKVEEKNGAATYTTTYTYDLLGNLTRTTDTNGNQTTITYDSVGRKTAMSDPDMGSWSYTYDAVGNLLTQTDAKGQPLTFTYDALNRVTRKSVPGTGTVPGTDVVYFYDDPVKTNGVGRLSKVTDGSGTTDFFYDLLGRELKTIKTVGGVGYTVERTYDALNRVTTLKYPDGEIVTYTYNPQGIERIEGTVPGGGLSPYVTNLDYTATGQLAKQVANGTLATTTYTYDPTTLRLSNVKLVNGANVTLQDLSYSFDGVGNVTALTDNRRNFTQSFTYDDLHRLVSAVSPGTYGTRTYAYDAIGNLTSKDGVTQTYAHPTKPHAVTSRSDGLTMTYDANGNMLTKGTQTLAYDAENRLIQVTSGGATQASFVYDGDGGRVQKVSPSGTTTYIGKLYEQKPDGTFVKYVWVGSHRLASKSSAGALLFYHPNHLGSTDLVTDAQGTQVAHYEYTPYGELFSTEGQVSVPHKFTGKELDPETGFYFYEARYYDPQLGRFITADPTIQHPSDPQDFNRYSYARDNPIRYTDPSGLGWNPFKRIAKWLGSIGRTVVSAVVAAAVFVTVTVATAGNVHLAASAAAATFAYTSTFLNASAQGASLGRAVGAATVNGAAAFAAVYLGWQAGPLAGAAIGASVGAAAGATSSAILGGSPGTGALSGAVGGGIMGGTAGTFGLIPAAAGAGAASAAVSGGNIGEGAYLGAIGAATFAIASASFQAALDAGRAQAGPAADGVIAAKTVTQTGGGGSTQTGKPPTTPTQPTQALTVNQGRFIPLDRFSEYMFRHGSAQMMRAGAATMLTAAAISLRAGPAGWFPAAVWGTSAGILYWTARKVDVDASFLLEGARTE